MRRWTMTKPTEGQYRLCINHGGKPFWCMFDYAVLLAPECDGVEIGLANDADAISAEWFPHLQRGMLQGLARLHESDDELFGMRVEIRKIYTHLTDTTARGCESYGRSFVWDVLRCGSVQIPERTTS